MQLLFACPKCQTTERVDGVESGLNIACRSCGWQRAIPTDDFAEGLPRRCLACGCEDLWRQKDFPQKLGLLLVGLGILFSTIAWARMEPLIAIGVLMGFALLDMALFILMPDVLVCYRCGARHRHVQPDEEHPKFNLETHERYRQEAIRLDEANRKSTPR